MFFEYALTVPANTAKASYASMDAPVSPGVVSLVSVQFPTGCAGLARVAIFRADHQVWPVNLDGHIASDGQTVTWPEQYEVSDEPMAFIIRGWNLDDTYQHVITVRFAVLPMEIAEQARALPALIGRIGRFLGIGAEVGARRS